MAIAGVVVAIGLYLYWGVNFVENDIVTYTASSTSEHISLKGDVLDEARKELERVTKELDEEEMKLKREITERQGRIDQIKEIRASFWEGTPNR